MNLEHNEEVQLMTPLQMGAGMEVWGLGLRRGTRMGQNDSESLAGLQRSHSPAARVLAELWGSRDSSRPAGLLARGRTGTGTGMAAGAR